MTIRGLLAEIKADLHKYDDSGAIDTSSVYRWAEIALKRFGGVIAVMSEAVIKTSNKQAVLPSDFSTCLTLTGVSLLSVRFRAAIRLRLTSNTRSAGLSARSAGFVGTPAPSVVRKSLRRRSRRRFISDPMRFVSITIIQ